MTCTALNDTRQIDRVQWLSLLVGVAALVVCVIGAVLSPTQFFRAYLPPYFFFLGLSIGSLALVMIYHLTGGAWGMLVRRIVEAQMKTLPLMALLFLPIALGLGYVYVWANSELAAVPTHKTVQRIYLDPTFFYLRTVGYFAIWLVLAYFLSAWSRRQDETGDAYTAWKCFKLSGPGLVIFGITLHFAAVDWIMSLDPRFTSTIFGPLLFSGQVLSAFALAVALFGWLGERAELRGLVSTKARNDLGSLLFTLLVLWAYMVWFQFMLVWMADLPRGNRWYLARGGGWTWLVWALLIFHFVVPFFMLLFRAVKRQVATLSAVAGWIVFMQLVFMYYQITPTFGAVSLAEHWMALVTPIGVGGVWLAAFLWLLKRMPLVPAHDINHEAAVYLCELDQEESAREEALAHG